MGSLLIFKAHSALGGRRQTHHVPAKKTSPAKKLSPTKSLENVNVVRNMKQQATAAAHKAPQQTFNGGMHTQRNMYQNHMKAEKNSNVTKHTNSSETLTKGLASSRGALP